MSADRVELARLLASVAADLSRRGYAYAGVVRQGARALAEPAGRETTPGGCRGCGEPLAYAGRGRPRQWCGERCRNRARKYPVMRR